MRRNYYPTHEEVAQRYPRLLRAMRWAACLSEMEAISCIAMHSAGHAYAGEAVNHYGGNLAVIRGAIRCRAASRRAYPRLYPMRAA